MKRSLVAAALGLALTAGTAHAGGILDSFGLRNPSTQGPGVYTTIDTMDWSSSGSGYAEGISANTVVLPVGTNFTFNYQAFLAGVTLGGPAVPFAGLNTAFEYTIVAKFQETVIDPLTGPGDTVVFSTLPGGTFGIYADTTPATFANVAAGTGFDNGTLVAEGIIEANQFSNFTVTGAGQGIGASIIQGLLQDITGDFVFINTDFLSALGGTGNPLNDIRFEATQNNPPLDSNTTGFFIGGDPTLYPDLLVTPGELVLKVDGSSKFSVVPEPSTYMLVGMGLLGLVGYSRKRSKN